MYAVVPFWTPTTLLAPEGGGINPAYTKSNTPVVSCKLSSKWYVYVLEPERRATHSMLKMRSGAMPVTDVYTPQGLPRIAWQMAGCPVSSTVSHAGRMAGPSAAKGGGQLLLEVSVVANCTLPALRTLAVVYVWPYKVKGKGRPMVVVHRPHCEPAMRLAAVTMDAVEVM